MHHSRNHSRFSLSRLLHHPELWRAGQLDHMPEAHASGFPALDEHLPGGGWPRAGLAELMLDTAGVGELRLLLPLIRALSRNEARWVAWINPPFIPYAPALEARGVDIRKILLIHTKSHQEALWALERASRSGTCSLALAWLDERQLALTDTRRLQLAARRGGTLTTLFRPAEAVPAKSMAELRLQVTPEEPGLVNVDIHKRRGGWPVSGIPVRLEDVPGPAEIREQLSLWRGQWQHQHREAEHDEVEEHPSMPPQRPALTSRGRVH
ncbi:MAG: translesion DNA synthesis-associated protein ImuA [Pseudomonadota bacterium]